ncbi:MAG: hypothetical protein J7647_05055 [Cyanobacteria bacterium SBLK]|nr:hypothetical protein [Cyanobacteria bacterium SBLK]
MTAQTPTVRVPSLGQHSLSWCAFPWRIRCFGILRHCSVQVAQQPSPGSHRLRLSWSAFPCVCLGQHSLASFADAGSDRFRRRGVAIGGRDAFPKPPAYCRPCRIAKSESSEEWIAEIDTARDKVIEALDIEKKWQISL